MGQAAGSALVVHGLPHQHLAGACTVADGPLGERGHSLRGRLVRLRPLKGLGATGAVGQDTMEAVRAAIAAEK